jgi:hypothetical protein
VTAPEQPTPQGIEAWDEAMTAIHSAARVRLVERIMERQTLEPDADGSLIAAAERQRAMRIAVTCWVAERTHEEVVRWHLLVHFGTVPGWQG